MRNFLIAFILIFLVTVCIVDVYTVVSPSMEDTLFVGDMIIILKFWYGIRVPFTDIVIMKHHKPSVNDILLFTFPTNPAEDYLKRCVAVGGQTVEVKEKKLYVDRVLVPLPAGGKHADSGLFQPDADTQKKKKALGISDMFGPDRRDVMPVVTVPDTAVFVMGDNRDFSLDSRALGFVPVSNIKGRAWLIFASYDPKISWADLKHKMRRGRWGRIK